MAKTQVTVEYKNENGAMVPIRVHTVLISTQVRLLQTPRAASTVAPN